MILSFIIDLQIECILTYISPLFKLLNMYLYFDIILYNSIRHVTVTVTVTVTMITILATNTHEFIFNNMLLNIQQDLYHFPTVVLN